MLYPDDLNDHHHPTEVRAIAALAEAGMIDHREVVTLEDENALTTPEGRTLAVTQSAYIAAALAPLYRGE